MNVKFHDDPFDHIIIDDFLDEKIAYELSKEVEEYQSSSWYEYDNELEKKKTIREWGRFPPSTYSVLFHLLSQEMTLFIKEKFSYEDVIVPDYGLHGAGWHMHKRGDHLNLHLDYSIHPKINLRRKYNLIYYISPNWNPEWGGALEFWSNDDKNNHPLELKKKIDCIFNRAVIFDTTQNSWHGFTEPISCPEGFYRKSIATYYLTQVDDSTEKRYRALYAPSDRQKNDESILKLIAKRVSL